MVQLHCRQSAVGESGAKPGRVVVIDAGSEYFDLRGVEVVGTVRVVGEVPRTGTPDKRLEAVEAIFGAKYTKGPFVSDGRHAWLQLTPEKMMSLDFRKTGRP
jgi:hypothetical protein